MATSETAIANSALMKLGADRIGSLEDSTREARILKEQFEKVRDDLLRSHPWNFAIERTSLAALTSEPSFGFTYEFLLPEDCLRVLEIDDFSQEWQKEGRKVRANIAPLYIKYIKKVPEVGSWDSCFCEVMATKLASEIAYAITQNAALKKQLNDEYLQKLREARSFDGQEGASRRVYADKWLNSRY